jgi:hypothetical protein
MQKYKLVFFGMIFFLMSCQIKERSTDPVGITQEYIEALNDADIDLAAEYISDNIVVSELNTVLLHTKEAWYELYRWDIEFSPEYKILEIYAQDGTIETVLSKACTRIDFLQDMPLIYKARFEFSDGKILRIDTYEYLEIDNEKWGPRKAALVEWIDENHPELAGFMIDQTAQGAKNYLVAIELYNQRKAQ